MSKYCVCCGASLPDSHKHRTCSMCYGDLDYGTDGYYRQYMEEEESMADGSVDAIVDGVDDE